VQDAIHVRLDEHARRLAELERTQPAVVASQVQGIKEDLTEIREEIRSFKRAAYSLAISIAGGAVIVALTAWQLGS
jgi:hypothetical protein